MSVHTTGLSRSGPEGCCQRVAGSTVTVAPQLGSDYSGRAFRSGTRWPDDLGMVTDVWRQLRDDQVLGGEPAVLRAPDRRGGHGPGPGWGHRPGQAARPGRLLRRFMA